MMRVSIILAALALASCSAAPAIKCDADGMIIIPKEVSAEIGNDWAARNMKLAGQRLDKLTGGERSRWATDATLEKAEGCP